MSAIKSRIKKNVFVFELGFYSVPSLICFLSYSSFSSLNDVWSHKQAELKESVEAGEEKPLWGGRGVSSGVAQSLSVSVLRTSDPRVCVCMCVCTCVFVLNVCSCYCEFMSTCALFTHTGVSVCVLGGWRGGAQGALPWGICSAALINPFSGWRVSVIRPLQGSWLRPNSMIPESGTHAHTHTHSQLCIYRAVTHILKCPLSLIS